MKPTDPSEKNQSTDFGFQQVPLADKAKQVAAVFNSVAGKYDLMNDLMSMGVHRLWKRYAIELANVRSGQYILDLAGGTGDLAMKFAPRVGAEGLVVLGDINESMLHKGRERLINKGLIGNVSYSQMDAEALPFPENSFDLITIAFGLRNVTRKERALEEMWRVLKPAGKVLILEFSKVTVPALASVYDTYSFKILPLLGKLIANDAESYRYLAESIRKHPDQESLRSMMMAAGFENCDYQNLSGGIVALHRGYKS